MTANTQARPDRRKDVRVAVIGARRVRQGTGAYLARSFAAAGADVVGVAGTSKDSADSARAELLDRYRIDCRAYDSLPSLIDRESPHVIVIASPPEAHRKALSAALDAGIHVLCEKPLSWPIAPKDIDKDLEVTRTIVRAFGDSGRLLALHEQWPFALPFFRRLYPEIDTDHATSFRMRLSPLSRGNAMVVDACPHPLSLLAAMVGPGSVSEVLLSAPGNEEELRLTFSYEHERGRVNADIILKRHESQPRPCWFEIDGKRAERRIDMRNYHMTLVGTHPDGLASSVELPDPLDLCVADFLGRFEGCNGTDVRGILSGVDNLRDLFRAVERPSS